MGSINWQITALQNVSPPQVAENAPRSGGPGDERDPCSEQNP
jgi:hypothetical protein